MYIKKFSILSGFAFIPVNGEFFVLNRRARVEIMFRLPGKVLDF